MKSRQIFVACLIALGAQTYAIMRLMTETRPTQTLASNVTTSFSDELRTGSAAPARQLGGSHKKEESQAEVRQRMTPKSDSSNLTSHPGGQ